MTCSRGLLVEGESRLPILHCIRNFYRTSYSNLCILLWLPEASTSDKYVHKPLPLGKSSQVVSVRKINSHWLKLDNEHLASRSFSSHSKSFSSFFSKVWVLKKVKPQARGLPQRNHASENRKRSFPSNRKQCSQLLTASSMNHWSKWENQKRGVCVQLIHFAV